MCPKFSAIVEVQRIKKEKRKWVKEVALTYCNISVFKVQGPHSESYFGFDSNFFCSNHFLASKTALLQISGVHASKRDEPGEKASCFLEE